MVWPEFRKLRRVFSVSKFRGNQRKKSKEKGGAVDDPVTPPARVPSSRRESRLQQVHPDPAGGSDEGWIEKNVEEWCQDRKVINDKGVKLLLKDGSWSSDDNTEKTDLSDKRETVTTIPNDHQQDPVEVYLESQLAQEKQNANRENNQEIVKDGLKQELEKEKRLRTEAEDRLGEVQLESDSCKARLANLQEDFYKMEEIVKSMIQFKSRIDQLQHEKSSLTLVYQSKLRKYQSCVASLEKENLMLLNELKSLEAMNKERQEESLSRMLLERLRLLEQENSSLVLENEQQRLQYECCLDDVANQVVQALMTQKSLREECIQLQGHVRDLEDQNRTLTILFKQRHHPSFNSSEEIEKDDCEVLFANIPRLNEDYTKEKKVSESYFEVHIKDSPSFTTSQSEDSTDSLASLCSEYSLQSGNGELNHLTQPGCAKMSSPPQWFQRPDPTFCAISLVGETIRNQHKSWANLFPPFKRFAQQRQRLQVGEEDPKLRFWKRRGVLLRERPLSDDLDAMDTPSDDSSSSCLEGLTIPSPSSFCGFPVEVQRSECGGSQVSSPNVPRPTTLNIVPHVMGDPAHNFNFPALEKKAQNACGNVYEEVDLPSFVLEGEAALLSSQYSGESPNGSNADTNTVVRRVSVTNPPETVEQKASTPEPPPLPSMDSLANLLKSCLVPTLPEEGQSSRNLLHEGESPLSVGEGGKDEGYSTMSSDVQGDAGPVMNMHDAVINAVFFSVPSPPLILSEMTTVVPCEYREGVMASSADSGLGLQKCGLRQSSVDVDEDLICPSLELKTIQEVRWEVLGTPLDSETQLDSGLGDSPSVHRMSSFSEPSGECKDEALMEIRTHRSSLDPSYDKILSLLTPVGFKATSQGGRTITPQTRSVACSSELRVETSEKSTSMEPGDGFFSGLCSSGLSLVSTESERVKAVSDYLDLLSHNRRSVDPSERSFICGGVNCGESEGSKSTTDACAAKQPRQCWDENTDMYSVGCRHCRTQCHRLDFVTRTEAIGSLLRAFSDSHLVRKRGFGLAGVKSASLGTRCPPIRLNLLPLEKHSSAIDLVTPRGNEDDDRMNRSAAVLRDLKAPHLVLGHQASPSLSLSTVHSSSSGGGAASAEEEEELGAVSSSMKCSREQDLSSDSEQDTLENQNFVEQWLQQGSTQLPHKLQNGYAYDEEEIGNWSFQLSAEDLSQSQPNDEVPWEESWEKPAKKKLQQIQEVSMEDDFWSAPLWSSSSGKMEDAKCNSSSNTSQQRGSPEKQTTNKVLLASPRDSSVISEMDQMDSLQSEVTEFNRDFYTLCNVGSTRSLAASVKSLVDADPKESEICLNAEKRNQKVQPILKPIDREETPKRTVKNATSTTSESQPLKEEEIAKVEPTATKISLAKKSYARPDRTRIPVCTKAAPKERRSIPKIHNNNNVKSEKRPTLQPKPHHQASSNSSGLKRPQNKSGQSHLRSTANRHQESKSRKEEKEELLQQKTISEQESGSNVDLEVRFCEVESENGLTVADKIQQLSALLAGTEPEPKVTCPRLGGKCPEDSRIPEVGKCEKKYQMQHRRAQVRRKKEGCGTSWVHFEADVDLSDPKARANLLDSMMASSSSSSEEEEEGDDNEVVEHKQHEHLHALHRFRRHKKRVANPDAVISYLPRLRASIVDRHDFFYRFGEKEKEAVACFDFLDDLSTSPSDAEANNRNMHGLPPPADAVRLPASPLHSFSSNTLNSQADYDTVDHISLSDSCAESYSSSTQSLNRLT